MSLVPFFQGSTFKLHFEQKGSSSSGNDLPIWTIPISPPLEAAPADGPAASAAPAASTAPDFALGAPSS
eukprot:3449374-Alexandrium_andersonii.AAC.1